MTIIIFKKLKEKDVLCVVQNLLGLSARFHFYYLWWYWIGLTKQEGNWIWDNHEPLTYTNWGPGEPNGCCGDNPICVFSETYDTVEQWNDWTCDDYGPSALCEIESMFRVIYCLILGFIQTVYFNNKSDLEFRFQKARPNSLGREKQGC